MTSKSDHDIRVYIQSVTQQEHTHIHILLRLILFSVTRSYKCTQMDRPKVNVRPHADGSHLACSINFCNDSH